MLGVEKRYMVVGQEDQNVGVVNIQCVLENLVVWEPKERNEDFAENQVLEESDMLDKLV